MRTVTTANQQFIESNRILTGHLVAFNLFNTASNTPENFYITDFHNDITYDGNTYEALGHLLGISNLDQSNDLQVQKVTFTLSSVDGKYISTIFNYRYISREVNILRIFVQEDGTIVGTHKIFTGKISQPNIKHNPDSDSVVSVSASSYLSDFDRKANRHTNHTEQTQRFPDDNFFKPFGTVNRDIVWGRET